MDTPALQLKNISKQFVLPTRRRDSITEYLTNPFKVLKEKNKSLKVLKNIDLTVKKGEFVGIMGKNGSGKSTLLKIISGIYTPTTGSVSTEGKLVPFLELGVGFNPELTGRMNVFFNGSILGMSQKFLKEKFNEIFEFAELEKFIDVPLKNYSSGMQIRLAFAIAMLTSADIYVLDEVLAVGDFSFRQKCLNIFKAMKKEGKTVILVSHSTGDIKDFCDTAYYLSNGTLVKGTSIQEVINKYEKNL